MSDQKRKTVRVRAAEGRILPMPPGVLHDSTATVLSGDLEVEVYADQSFLLRRLRAGDLVEVAALLPPAPAKQSTYKPKAEE